jgi:hypothetical protein
MLNPKAVIKHKQSAIYTKAPYLFTTHPWIIFFVVLFVESVLILIRGDAYKPLLFVRKSLLPSF